MGIWSCAYFDITFVILLIENYSKQILIRTKYLFFLKEKKTLAFKWYCVGLNYIYYTLFP